MPMRTATILSPEAVETRDRTDMAVLVAQPPGGDVTGQGVYEEVVICPGCGSIGWVMANSDALSWGICGQCGAGLEF